MTIAETDRTIKELIKEHHVYGAEAVINALVRASQDEPYLDEGVYILMIQNAYKHIKEVDVCWEAL